MNGSSWSESVVKTILASTIAAIVVGLSAWTLHEVSVMEKTVAKLDADDEMIKLILNKFADRMNTGNK